MPRCPYASAAAPLLHGSPRAASSASASPRRSAGLFGRSERPFAPFFRPPLPLGEADRRRPLRSPGFPGDRLRRRFALGEPLRFFFFFLVPAVGDSTREMTSAASRSASASASASAAAAVAGPSVDGDPTRPAAGSETPPPP